MLHPHPSSPILPPGVVDVVRQIDDLTLSRRVVVRFAGAPADAAPRGLDLVAHAIGAVEDILDALALEPFALEAVTVRCERDTPALKLATPAVGRPGAGRVVAFVTEGLTEWDLHLCLLWWAAHWRRGGAA